MTRTKALTDTGSALDPPKKPSVTSRGSQAQLENLAPAKRKRSALVDATNGKGAKALAAKTDNVKDAPDPLAKHKRTASVSSGTTTVATNTTSRRQPLALKSRNENATIERQALHPLPKRSTSRVPTKSATATTKVTSNTTIAARRTQVLKTVDPPVRSNTAARSIPHSRTRTITVVVEDEEVAEDEDEIRAHKKRRISEDDVEVDLQIRDIISSPEMPLAEEIIDVVDAKAEEDDDVKDLDQDDLDDPLMVAEYVGEIFEYLKEVEVSVALGRISQLLTLS